MLLLSAAALPSSMKLAKIASILPEGPIVTYCNSGHWSATEWFVLSEVLHRTDVKHAILDRIPIPRDAARRVREELNNIGINERSMFPDLEGLARSMGYELEFHWAYNPRTLEKFHT